MATMTKLDLNGDIGEQAGDDAALLPLLSSANICCGSHAGNTAHTLATITLAQQHQIAIGAHPGYDDRANFGRLELNLSNKQILDSLQQQLALFTTLIDSVGATMHHIKLHGALYHRGNHQVTLAEQICAWLVTTYPNCMLYCQAQSPLVAIATAHGLSIKQEGFADRRYLNSGLLAPRTMAGSCIAEPQQVLTQVQQMVEQRSVTTINGQQLPLTVDTLCLHGDSITALESAQNIHRWCANNNIVIDAN
ncbi:5-oxoprolinase subunit PxpA [Ferrimonas lipolytica]|uniref:5-oxoprolinase subunit PxpA n=1 Tax=Ferrimonas lipolytica TaxID=2724191 RepID=A0A6H1UDF5_9GAMM|nr:5-oxoprolinase subunit PxpA [Ferrimonas lipolytica]QIZ77137.1 5-oxoprolinase subunit PxpA [Ferrimonas lipolytica]